jgi:hypothetical protein
MEENKRKALEGGRQKDAMFPPEASTQGVAQMSSGTDEQ